MERLKLYKSEETGCTPTLRQRATRDRRRSCSRYYFGHVNYNTAVQRPYAVRYSRMDRTSKITHA
eukprot:6177787-Pleurochrysis_carterae.AAC.2